MVLATMLLLLSGCQTLMVSSRVRQECQTVLFKYQEALNQRSSEKLFGLMGDTIRVDGMTDELSRAGLKAGMHWPPSQLTGSRILSLLRKPDGYEVKAAFFLRNAYLLMRFGLDESLRIRTIDPVPLWKAPEAAAAAAFTSGFVEDKGLMFVKASVNGRSGFFLCDTGSSGLLVNKKYFTADAPGDLPGITSTVRGIKPRYGRASIHSFQWGNIRSADFRGELHDFSMMESPANSPLLGAIGHEQLKNCAVLFDWRNRRISVRPASGKRADARGKTSPPPQAIVAFSSFLHAPAFAVKIGRKSCPVIFDSGAQVNLLPRLDGLETHFHKVAGTTRISDGGELGNETALLGSIDELWIGGSLFRDQPFAIFEVPYLSGQGIVGTPLLRKNLLEIDFPKKTISIW